MKRIILGIAILLFTTGVYAQKFKIRPDLEIGYGFSVADKNDELQLDFDKLTAYAIATAPLGDFEVGIGAGINIFKDDFVEEGFQTYPVFARFAYNLPWVDGLYVNMDVGHMFYNYDFNYSYINVAATGKLHITGNVGYNYELKNGITVGAFAGYNMQKMNLDITLDDEYFDDGDYDYKVDAARKFENEHYVLKLPSIDAGIKVTF